VERKEAIIFIYGYGSAGVLPLICLSAWCTLPLLALNARFLFQNLTVDITEVQTLRGIVLLGGDFNAHTTMLLNTIDIRDLCELL
jgi:hypothetical protein